MLPEALVEPVVDQPESQGHLSAVAVAVAAAEHKGLEVLSVQEQDLERRDRLKQAVTV